MTGPEIADFFSDKLKSPGNASTRQKPRIHKVLLVTVRMVARPYVAHTGGLSTDKAHQECAATQKNVLRNPRTGKWSPTTCNRLP